MRKYCLSFIVYCLLSIICGNVFAGEVITVCGQNLQNYFWSLDRGRTTGNSVANSNYSTEAGRTKKTTLIVNALKDFEADIYAFNELEAKPQILIYLAQKMSEATGHTYAAVEDDIDYDLTTDADGLIKSGFIYRTDKVMPYGRSATTGGLYEFIYPYLMRIQTFEALASHERFTLTMNHFKAGGVEYANQRAYNATSLLQGVNKALDADILVIGDLNCELDEEALQMLMTAGYEEQMVRYNSSSIYTYSWSGGTMFIDHVFANATMAAQVTDAHVYHVANKYTVGNANAYSDHDPYVVTLNLQPESPAGGDISYSEPFSESLGRFYQVNVTGKSLWTFYTNGTYAYAMMNGYSSGENEDWLLSPYFDLRGMSGATLKVRHCAGYGSSATWGNYLKLYVSTDYFEHADMPNEASWEELPISTFGTRNWDWQNMTQSLPDNVLNHEHVCIGFKYTSGTSDIPAWELQKFELTATYTGTGFDMIQKEHPALQPRKVFRNGHCYILMPNGSLYSLTGARVKE